MMYSLYDTDGRVFLQFELPLGEIDPLGFLHAMIQGNNAAGCINAPCDMATQYVLNGQIQDRPASPATLEGHVLSNLPTPCEIFVNGTTYECDDEVVELDLAGADSYRVRVRAWPYYDKEWVL